MANGCECDVERKSRFIKCHWRSHGERDAICAVTEEGSYAGTKRICNRSPLIIITGPNVVQT
jgi:hypothetical protein